MRDQALRFGYFFLLFIVVFEVSIFVYLYFSLVE